MMKFIFSQKKIAIASIAAAVVLIGAGVSLLAAFHVVELPNFLHVTRHTVVLKADGFHPAKFTIHEGDTVVFKSATGQPFWPASNVHPTHTAYPAFDPKRPIPADESWEFTFPSAGTYLFHDHIASNFEGAITVVKKDGTRVEADCSKDRTVQCWESMMLETLDKEGVESALNKIVYLSETEPLFANDCHGYTHLIGEKAYKLYAEHRNFELTPATALCGYGFYHGFMETLLLTTGDIDEARGFCRMVDEKLSGKASAAATACFHGTGHGAIDGSDPTTWGDSDAMIAPGFKVCSLLAQTELETYLCETGVFNAIEILSHDPKYMITDIREDPFAFCNRQTLARREGCYSNMLPLILEKFDNDVEKSADYINANMIDNNETAIDGHTINELVTIGLMFEYIRLQGESPDYAQKGIAMCRSFPEEDHLACIEGLSGGHVKYGEPGIEYIKNFEFCKNPLLTNEEVDSCYKYTLPRMSTRYDPDTTKMICDQVPVEYKNKYCLQ